MYRSVQLGSLTLFVMVVMSAGLFAQFNRGATSPSDPRVRRANRESAVAKTGPIGREFVELYGDDAVAAIFACSNAVAIKLAEFHASGALGKLPRPCDLLRLIARPRHRDDVARWAMQHADELADADSFDAYLASPLEYAMGLKQLQAGAAEARANRLNPPEAATEATATPPPTTLAMSLRSLMDDDRVVIACCIGLVILLVACRRRRSAIH